MFNLNVNVAIKPALTALKQQYTGDGIKCVWLAGGTLQLREQTAGTFQRFTGTASPNPSHPSSFIGLSARAYTHTHEHTHTAAKLPIRTQDLCLKIHKSPKFHNSTGGGLQLCLDDYVLIIFVTCLRH